jgi:hypothetical protein
MPLGFADSPARLGPAPYLRGTPATNLPLHPRTYFIWCTPIGGSRITARSSHAIASNQTTTNNNSIMSGRISP